MSSFEAGLPSFDDNQVINLRREPWSNTGMYLTLYDLRVGEAWVRVEAHDFGTTVFDYPDGTRIIDDKERTVTLHPNRDMTVAVKDENRVESYSAAILDEGAAELADAIRRVTEGQSESERIDFPE
jgi:hypothetical protein